MTPTIKAKPKPVVELNPYDPVGIGVGSLRLTPFVETSTGYDSNPDRLSSSNIPAPTGSKLLRARRRISSFAPTGSGTVSRPICASAMSTISTMNRRAARTAPEISSAATT